MICLFLIGILSIAVSLDALGVGLAYGMKKIKIPMKYKLMMAAFSILYTGIAVSIGNIIVKFLPPIVTNFIGSLILAGMGVWLLLQGVFKKTEEETETIPECKTVFEWMIKSLGITIQITRNPVSGDVDRSGYIDLKESLLIGAALSLDILGVGLGCAMIGLNIWLIPFTVAAAQLLFLSSGLYLGKLLAKRRMRWLDFAPGIILIVIAIMRWFG